MDIQEKITDQKKVWCWNEESTSIYNENTDKTEKIRQNDNFKEKWEELKVHFQQGNKKGIKIRNWCLGEKKWWDRECSKKKREVLRCF